METEMERWCKLAIERMRELFDKLEEEMLARADRARAELIEKLVTEDLGVEMSKYRLMVGCQTVVSEDRKMGPEDLGERASEHIKMVRREMLYGKDLVAEAFEHLKMARREMLVEVRKMGVFEDLDMGMWGSDNKPESQASSSKFTIPNDSQGLTDLEMGLSPGEIQPRQFPSGIWTSCGDYLSWATKGKRFNPHQPRPSENAEPGPEPEPELEPPHDDDYGEVKEAKGGLSKVTLATQMVLPAAVGWGGYFVIGQGALYNSAFAFSVFGVHVLGILCMFIGWYLETKNPRGSGRMQKLGQALCIACLILTQIPVSKKLK